MATPTTNPIEQLRTRLAQRADSNLPVWPVAVKPCAERNALALLMGTLLGKLPNDDVAPLVRPILLEQLENGSWGNDVSRTLEIVQALSQSQRPEARPSLSKAVDWLEAHPSKKQLRVETLLLLGHATGLGAPLRYKQIAKPALHAALEWSLRHAVRSRKLAAHLLMNEPGTDAERVSQLIRRQHSDGSWNGDARTTTLAMSALRQAGLPASDTLFERGYRFLRVLQQWDGEDLVQAPNDVSMALHAMALRSLLLAGMEPNDVAGHALLLAHAQDASGGWSIGSGQPVDVMTTALALDALSLFGDEPLETRWARRRAVEFLSAVQLRDGSFAQLPRGNWLARRGVTSRTSLEATSLALLALCESGETGAVRAMNKAAHFVRRAQSRDGSFPRSTMQSQLVSTVLAAEALDAFGGHRAQVERALEWIIGKQHVLGGFGESGGLTSWHTAMAIRGLSLRPARFAEQLAGAREHLLLRQDEETKWWIDSTENLCVPSSDEVLAVNDVTAIAALEALHTGSRVRAQRTRMQRKYEAPRG